MNYEILDEEYPRVPEQTCSTYLVLVLIIVTLLSYAILIICNLA